MGVCFVATLDMRVVERRIGICDGCVATRMVEGEKRVETAGIAGAKGQMLIKAA
jgi:hypothetical protein